ncbi:hypothetical protein AAF712_000767 [Marasmius tenuissimus]|uniref:HAT C-terminal dimerisation domain-containing protein n=1 Tax=Marasmius tenuissimus TaxID=585030 RepID=A0ABR3AEE2_9AGAR
MSPRTPLWTLFWTNDEGFSPKDQQHKKAWCVPCIDESVELLRAQETTQIAHGSLPEENRTGDAKLREKAILSVKFICSKSEQMLVHLKSCKAIKKSPELSQKRDNIIASFESTRTQRQPSQPRQPFQQLPPFQVRACVVLNRVMLLNAGGPKAEQTAKAAEVIGYCDDTTFWNNLARIIRHMEPLAIAVNVLQSHSCRFDQVLLTLGNLFRIFNDLSRSDPDDEAVRQAIHKSLERRWKSADQEVMILAVFFNPFIRSRCFNADFLPPIQLFHIMCRVYARLRISDPVEDNDDFLGVYREYSSRSGIFSDMAMGLEFHKQESDRKGKPLNLVEIWEMVHGNSSGQQKLVQLAIHILLIVPNSAATESTFSTFGCIQTKTRNKLHPQKVHKTTVVKTDCLRSHQAANLVPVRKKRQFGKVVEAEEDVPSEVPTAELVARELIAGAEQDEVDHGDNPEPTRPSLDIPTFIHLPSGSRIPQYTKITLGNLFKYPPSGLSCRDLGFYWKGGLRDLEEEARDLDTPDEGAENTT